MPIVVATVLTASGFTAPTGPSVASTISSAEHETMTCYVTCEWRAGTYAQADDATFDPSTVIQDALRDGQTITVLGAIMASAGVDSTDVIIGAGLVSDITANVVTLPLTLEDLTSERTNALAMEAVWDRPICMAVTFHRPINA